MENNNEYITGASAAINKSIKQLEEISKGNINFKDEDLRSRFRDKCIDVLTELGIKWYKIGFKRGHKESHLKFNKTKSFPKTLKKKMNVKLLKGKVEKKIILKSKIT